MRRAWTALNRHGGRELLADTLVYTLAKGVPGLLGLASVIFFLRLTNPGAYGLYALLSSIVSVWATFAAGWFYQGVLRFGDAWGRNRPVFRSTIVAGVAISSAIFCVGGYAHVLVTGQARSLGLVLSSLGLGCLIVAQTTLLSVLQTTLQPKKILRTELVRSVACFCCAAICALAFRDQAAGLLAGTALGYGLSFVGASPNKTWLKSGNSDDKSAVRCSLAQAWRYGWPLSLWFAGQLCIPLIDRTMIASRLGLEETGKFSGLSDILTRCFSLAVFPITQAAYPRLARLIDENNAVAARALLRRAGFLLILAGAIILPVIFFSRQLIVKFALSAFDSNHARLVLPLAAGGLVWQAALLVHKPLELTRRTHLMLLAMAAAVGLKAALNLWLLAPLGALGAALATLSSGLAYCLLSIILSRTVRK